MNYEFQPTCQIPPEKLDQIYMDAFGFKRDGVFVEVGAHDGWHWSNTWGLAEIGWRGIYIEPVCDLYLECVKTNAQRKNITVVNCSIGSTDGKTMLYMGEYGATAEVEGEPFESLQHKLDTLLQVEQIIPRFDLLVIDVEGSEVSVLAGFDWRKWLPKLIIVERPPAAFDCLLSHYDKIYEDWINAIYQRHDHA